MYPLCALMPQITSPNLKELDGKIWRQTQVNPRLGLQWGEWNYHGDIKQKGLLCTTFWRNSWELLDSSIGRRRTRENLRGWLLGPPSVLQAWRPGLRDRKLEEMQLQKQEPARKTKGRNLEQKKHEPHTQERQDMVLMFNYTHGKHAFVYISEDAHRSQKTKSDAWSWSYRRL